MPKDIFECTTYFDVAESLGVKANTLRYHLYRAASHRYTIFEIKKKSGGTRKIFSPIDSFKNIQRILMLLLQTKYRPKNCAHGFITEKSIVTNADAHVGKKLVLNIDLLDFFPTINFGRVRGAFIGKPYNAQPKAATVLAQICCYNNLLPQGAPTSPIVSNIVCQKLDGELTRLALANRCHYTRYADDITFSTYLSSFPENILINNDNLALNERVQQSDVGKIIKQNGFSINEKKIRLQKRGQRMSVTGLVVNKFTNVPRSYVREIRAMIHAAQKFGIHEAEREYLEKFRKKHRRPGRGLPSFEYVLKGKLAYLKMVKGEQNPVYLNLCERLRRINPHIINFDSSPNLRSRFESIVVVESSQSQGTAFFVTPTLLITCCHVVEKSNAHSIYWHDDPNKMFPVKILKKDEKKDIAILEVEGIRGKPLKRSRGMNLGVGTQVEICGFPNHATGRKGHSASAVITGELLDTGSNRRFTVGTQIITGTSGGPVLNDRGSVVAIAATGGENYEQQAESTVIPITTAQQVLDEVKKVLSDEITD